MTGYGQVPSNLKHEILHNGLGFAKRPRKIEVLPMRRRYTEHFASPIHGLLHLLQEDGLACDYWEALDAVSQDLEVSDVQEAGGSEDDLRGTRL